MECSQQSMLRWIMRKRKMLILEMCVMQMIGKNGMFRLEKMAKDINQVEH